MRLAAFRGGAFTAAAAFRGVARFTAAFRAVGSLTTAFLVAAFPEGDFFGVAFFGVACFGVAFLAVTFFVAAFLAAAFLAGAFFAGSCLAAAFLAGAFFAGAFRATSFRAGALVDPPSSFRLVVSVARPGDLRAVAGAPPRAAPDAFPRAAVDERPEPGVVLPSLERFFATPALPLSGVLFRGIFGMKLTHVIPAVNLRGHIPRQWLSRKKATACGSALKHILDGFRPRADGPARTS